MVSGACILSLYFPRTYTATISFERRKDPVMMQLALSPGAASYDDFSSSLRRGLKSVSVLSDVVEKLGLTKDFEKNDDGSLTRASKRRRDSLARSLASRIEVTSSTPTPQMDLVRIKYTGPDPTIGKRLVDEVKRTYISQTMVWIHEFLKGQRDYFQDEAEIARTELRKAEREEIRIRFDYPLLNPKDPGSIARRLSQLEIEGRELKRRRREYVEELTALRKHLATIAPTHTLDQIGANNGDVIEVVPTDPEMTKLVGKIGAIDEDIKRLKTTRGMTNMHPEILAMLEDRRGIEQILLRNGIRLSEDAIANGAMGKSAAPAIKALTDVTARVWEGEQARLIVSISAQQAKLKDLNLSIESNESSLEGLHQAKNNVFSKQEEFADIASAVSKAETRLAGIEATVTSIIPAIKAIEQGRLLQFTGDQPATGSSRPVAPKSTTVVLLSLLAGLAAGAFCVILAEIVDHVYRTSGQVARSLGLPILESIDEIVTGKDRRKLFISHAVVTPLIAICCVGLVGLTASMAYLSLEQPWTYQRVRKIPEAALRMFIGDDKTDLTVAAVDGG